MTLEEAGGRHHQCAASLDRADRVGSLEVGNRWTVMLDGTLADIVNRAPVIRR